MPESALIMPAAAHTRPATPAAGLPVPLARVLAEVTGGLAPVPIRHLPVPEAEYAVLAQDLVVPSPVPARAVALRRGVAVLAADTLGAAPYSPLPLPAVPPLVDAGQALPPGTDAVLPQEAITVAGSLAEAQDSASPGLWARRVGEDARAYTALRRAGEQVRSRDLALANAAGIPECDVRSPRVLLAVAAPSSAAAQLVGMLARAASAQVRRADTTLGRIDQADLVFGIGDVRNLLGKLAGKGARVIANRLALRPGEDGAVLKCGTVPVVLAPDRVADALAVWLAVGLPVLRALAGAVSPSKHSLPLTRKISSGVGMAEIALLRIAGNRFEPLATGDFPLAAIAAADAWMLLAPESEGVAAGETVGAELLLQ